MLLVLNASAGAGPDDVRGYLTVNGLDTSAMTVPSFMLTSYIRKV